MTDDARQDSDKPKQAAAVFADGCAPADIFALTQMTDAEINAVMLQQHQTDASLGMLYKFFNEAHIPPYRRNAIAVIVQTRRLGHLLALAAAHEQITKARDAK